MSDLPLAGVKVLDLTQHVAGPFCTKLLADWGAEVIKIENPQSGDLARRMGPFLHDQPDSEGSGLFLYLNTNKKSVTLNLKTATGAGLFKDLVKESDIVVESFKPGTMEVWGLSYEALRKVNGSLVMVSISNFGQTGPYREYKGTDLTLSALGGMTSQQRREEGPPYRLGGMQALYKTGVAAFVAATSGLLYKALEGQGQHLDISILECAAIGDTGGYSNYTYTGASYTGKSLAGLFGHPATVYPCKDGYVYIATGLGNIEHLALIMGQPELMQNPVFADRYARQQHTKEFDALILPWLMEHGKKEIEALAQEILMPFGAILTIDEVLQDEHLRERQFFVGIEHPHTGTLTYPGTPMKMSASAPKHDRAPLLGEHNSEVLQGRLGLDSESMVRLKAVGVI